MLIPISPASMPPLSERYWSAVPEKSPRHPDSRRSRSSPPRRPAVAARRRTVPTRVDTPTTTRIPSQCVHVEVRIRDGERGAAPAPSGSTVRRHLPGGLLICACSTGLSRLLRLLNDPANFKQRLTPPALSWAHTARHNDLEERLFTAENSVLLDLNELRHSVDADHTARSEAQLSAVPEFIAMQCSTGYS